MSDYNEHLISMAGGDGDVVAEIAARIPQIHESEMSRAEKDRAALLAMVREQRAVIERVEVLVEILGARKGHLLGWVASNLRAALATPDAS
jgi:hypothetical protein